MIFFCINVEDVKECCFVKILVYYIDQELFKQSCYAYDTKKY